MASANGTGDSVLLSTATVSANDVWSVGFQTNASSVDRTLAEHWNGTSWTIFPTVNPASSHDDLFGVSAVSSSNVWAVGAYETNSSTNTTATMAQHWNGKSWSKVATVNPSTYSYLYAVTALSSNNVWAVGTYWNFSVGSYLTLVEHYNGSTWARVSSPNTGASDTWNQLFAISAWSATDIWAVGSLSPSVGPLQSLAVHYNGTSWSVVATPNGGGDNEILGVNALESNHAVGVGYDGYVSTSSPAQAFQWDLSTSGSSASPLTLGVTGNVLLENVARASDGVWAVGFYQTTVSSPRQTLVWKATWDPSIHSIAWASAPGTSASPGAINNVLFGVAAVSPSVFWAAGYLNNLGTDQTLTELYCALHFDLAAPATAIPGSPFAVTVTAKNADNSTATNYRGTVHFTSSDAQAVLPPDYTFTQVDAGAHTFSGVVLRDTSNQPSSITASDTVTTFITGSANVTVACIGVCASPAGTPGSRDVLPGPGGIAGPRSAIHPRAGAQAPRTPQRNASLGASLAGAAHPATTIVAHKVGLRIVALKKTLGGVTSATSHSSGSFAVKQERDTVMVSHRINASTGNADPVSNVEGAISLGLLAFGLLALRRRRIGEELNVRNKA
jgi:MYXO-CTERM domain-containing protein